MKKQLSHLDESGQPRMVDVSAKAVTARTATAEAVIRFPELIWDAFAKSGFSSKKGPVLDVARIAGTGGVKQTANLIPFCHTLPIDGCDFDLEPIPEACSIRIRCTVKCTARTGVEMEALTGASVAALTIYDMTKSLGHGMEIENVRLLSKTGGKEEYVRDL
jgi:cyclic pyranopterin phosphate synthase